MMTHKKGRNHGTSSQSYDPVLLGARDTFTPSLASWLRGGIQRKITEKFGANAALRSERRAIVVVGGGYVRLPEHASA